MPAIANGQAGSVAYNCGHTQVYTSSGLFAEHDLVMGEAWQDEWEGDARIGKRPGLSGRGTGYYAKQFEPREWHGGVSPGFAGWGGTTPCWQLAEAQGEAHPYGFQRLLGRAQWDADGVRGMRRELGDHTRRMREGVLIVDETGFEKGRHSAGYSANTVARQAGSRTVRSACFWPMPVVGTGLIDRALFLQSVVGGSLAVSGRASTNMRTNRNRTGA